jgi:hypothetical protein
MIPHVDMIKRMSVSYFVISAVFQASCLQAQTTTYSPEVEKHIQQVENNLTRWVQIQDTSFLMALKQSKPTSLKTSNNKLKNE